MGTTLRRLTYGALHGRPAAADRPEHARRRFAVGVAIDAEVEVRLVEFGEVEQALSVRAQVRHGEERVDAGRAAPAVARAQAIGVEAADFDRGFAAADRAARPQHQVDDREERAGAVERRAGPRSPRCDRRATDRSGTRGRGAPGRRRCRCATSPTPARSALGRAASDGTGLRVRVAHAPAISAEHLPRRLRSLLQGGSVADASQQRPDGQRTGAVHRQGDRRAPRRPHHGVERAGPHGLHR